MKPQQLFKLLCMLLSSARYSHFERMKHVVELSAVLAVTASLLIHEIW